MRRIWRLRIPGRYHRGFLGRTHAGLASGADENPEECGKIPDLSRAIKSQGRVNLSEILLEKVFPYYGREQHSRPNGLEDLVAPTRHSLDVFDVFSKIFHTSWHVLTQYLKHDRTLDARGCTKPVHPDK